MNLTSFHLSTNLIGAPNIKYIPIYTRTIINRNVAQLNKDYDDPDNFPILLDPF